MPSVIIRPGIPSDIDSILQVVLAAFENHPHSNLTEHLLIDALKEAAVLTLSLVAVVDGKIFGHIAFSPVTIDGMFCDWYGLAPVSVHPTKRRQGIGGRLIVEGLKKLRVHGAKGCVLLGEPDYYSPYLAFTQ